MATITLGELSDISDLIRTLGDNTNEYGHTNADLALDVTLTDSNGETVGVIGFDGDVGAYGFKAGA